MKQAEHSSRVILDPAALQSLDELTGSDPDILDELVTAFLEDAPLQLRAMREAAASGDAESLRRAAHSLKSTSLTFGATALGGISRELEEQGKRGICADVLLTIELAERAFSRATTALEALRPAERGHR